MSALENAITALSNQLNSVLSRLDQLEGKISSGAQLSTSGSASASAAGEGDGLSPAVQEYQSLIDQFITPYVEDSKGLEDPVVLKQAELVLQAVNKQRDFLVVASKSKKPDDGSFQKLLGPTSELMGQISGLKDSAEGRKSKLGNNLSTVAEGIGALGWVCVAPTPGPHVADMRGGSEFYSNRILKEFKGNNQTQVNFVQHFNGFLKELQVFIKKNHTTGLTWNPRGGDAASATVLATPSAPAGPPPPPSAPSSSAPPAADMGNVFASLNKGEGVTSGLKKVTADMKSKNNANKSSVVPADIAPKATTTKSGAKPAITKPPKFALEGNKWVVEFQQSNKSLIVNETEPKQTVYIYKCHDSVVQIKGKVNAITLDDCSKTSVVFEDVVASFEVVNCKSVEVQVQNAVPSIAIDKTSGIQVYLSKTSLHTEIVTSKSDQMNVLLPDSVNGFEEKAIPEQYKTVVRNGTLVTEINSHV